MVATPPGMKMTIFVDWSMPEIAFSQPIVVTT
jgi:hypothetical protein